MKHGGVNKEARTTGYTTPLRLAAKQERMSSIDALSAVVAADAGNIGVLEALVRHGV